jgi:hypothetical protein
VVVERFRESPIALESSKVMLTVIGTLNMSGLQPASQFHSKRSDQRVRLILGITGGWYAQPHNWKANTAIMFTVIFGVTAIFWKISAEREVRYKMPEPHRFFPSRK